MRRFFIIAALSILPLISINAQELSSSFKSESKVSSFENTKGIVLKREVLFISEPMIYDLDIKTCMYTDLRTREMIGYVILGFNYLDDTHYTSYIDYDELQDCIDALTLIMEKEAATIPHAVRQEEVFYRTKDGVQIGISYDLGGDWEMKILQSKYELYPSITLGLSYLKKVVKELQRAKSFLDKKFQLPQS